MSNHFEKTIFVAYVFTNDLKQVYLKKCNPGYDGFRFSVSDQTKISFVELTETLNRFGFNNILPGSWRIVTTIPKVDKTVEYMVVSTQLTPEAGSVIDDSFIMSDVDNIVETALPSNRWLIPLCLDPCIIGSTFNQIIIR